MNKIIEIMDSAIERLNNIRESLNDCECPEQKLELPEGWGLRRHVKGVIVVTHKDGSGVMLKDDPDNYEDSSIAESLFYRMMDEILNKSGG